MCGLSKASQWQGAQALYVIGSLGEYGGDRELSHPDMCSAANIVTAFYAATFPGLVRDLPKLIQSEQDVQTGAKS